MSASHKPSSKPCELILALDVPSREEAFATLDALGQSLSWVKIGLQLFTRYGPDFVEAVHRRGYKIFLDLKLHDIPNTVAKSVASLCALPIELTTVHTLGGSAMLAAANQARLDHNPQLQLLGVTVLTSHDAASLAQLGIVNPLAAQVEHLAALGIDAGLQGLVCSPLEVALLRKRLGCDCLLVTPGIRPVGAGADDQKRAMTPAEAAMQGSSYIVVGRPILKADSPRTVVESIQRELQIDV